VSRLPLIKGRVKTAKKREGPSLFSNGVRFIDLFSSQVSSLIKGCVKTANCCRKSPPGNFLTSKMTISSERPLIHVLRRLTSVRALPYILSIRNVLERSTAPCFLETGEKIFNMCKYGEKHRGCVKLFSLTQPLCFRYVRNLSVLRSQKKAQSSRSDDMSMLVPDNDQDSDKIRRHYCHRVGANLSCSS